MTLFITTQSELQTFCASLDGADFLTVDTEFLRERTYYPKLCLLQIGGPNSAACIDPLAGLDLAPLYDVLYNPAILKVFHAARQDLEIFYNLRGALPLPVADTQVMAMVCGFGDSVSYETLASKLAKAKIDKSSRFTDWAARPLTPKQIDYALADVTHLRTIFIKLQLELASKNRESWIADELAQLTDPKIYIADPKDAWQRLRMRLEKSRTMALAQRLAAWREQEAQSLNIPRGRVLKDETLQEIIFHPPRDMAQLLRMRGLPNGFAESRFATTVLQIVAEVDALPESELPSISQPRASNNESLSATVELLKVLLRYTAAEYDVANKLLATTDDLEELAANDEAAIPALRGWRRDIFGARALQLKHGQLALTLKNKKIVLTEVTK